MAKELPYFKFFVSEWNDGDITLEDYETQGLFINLCAYYWSNECEITLTKSKKKFRNCGDDSFNYLIENDIIKVENDIIIINFLDEQKDERLESSKRKSKGGKASAEARKLKKLTESQQETNTSSTEIQQVLNSCSTEVQVLREEKRREEEIRKEVNGDTDFVYSLYPTKCLVKKSNTGKSSADKRKIEKLLKTISKDKLSNIIERYKKDCVADKIYMKNFGTFLNNLPDYEASELVEIDNSKYTYYKLKGEFYKNIRRIEKGLEIKEPHEILELDKIGVRVKQW